MATRKTTVAGAPVAGVPAKARVVRARQVAKGDIPPTATQAGIEGFVVHAAVDGAQESKLGAMRDVIAGLPTDDSLAMLKGLLKEQRMVMSEQAPNPDEELVKDWRGGTYPYRNLMLRAITSARNTACRSNCSSCRRG